MKPNVQDSKQLRNHPDRQSLFSIQSLSNAFFPPPRIFALTDKVAQDFHDLQFLPFYIQVYKNFKRKRKKNTKYVLLFERFDRRKPVGKFPAHPDEVFLPPRTDTYVHHNFRLQAQSLPLLKLKQFKMNSK